MPYSKILASYSVLRMCFHVLCFVVVYVHVFILYYENFHVEKRNFPLEM